MSTTFTPVRSLVLMLAVALTAHAADARSEPTARSTARSASTVPPTTDGVPIDGLLIIIGIVAVIILLAWVCSRISDS